MKHHVVGYNTAQCAWYGLHIGGPLIVRGTEMREQKRKDPRTQCAHKEILLAFPPTLAPFPKRLIFSFILPPLFGVGRARVASLIEVITI